jgi:ribosomal subunit interface protein
MRVNYAFQAQPTDQERDYLEDKVAKVGKLLDAKQDDELMVDVEVSQNRHNFWRAEIMVTTPHWKFRSEKEQPTFVEAVDGAKEALMKQIRREKERVRDDRRRG